MGFLAKMKSIANAVTGGAAKVSVAIEPWDFGEPLRVTIRATAKDAEVPFNRVYLVVEGVESIEIPDFEFSFEDGSGERGSLRQVVRARHTTIRQEFEVASAGSLQAEQSGEWTVEIELPENAAPTYNGRFAEHHYQVFAGLDTKGNDPDSGWVRIAA